VISTARDGRQGLFEKSVTGSAGERAILLSEDNTILLPLDWSSEHGVIFGKVDPATRWNIYQVRATGSAASQTIVNGPAIEIGGRVSADERLLSYLSDEAGSVDLFVRTLKGDVQKAQVATAVTQQWWAPGGRALLYVKRDQTLWQVPVDSGMRAPRIGTPEQLAALPAGVLAMDLAADGKRLLALVPENAGFGAITVVQSWTAALPAILNRR
jgi:hypothetical protein